MGIKILFYIFLLVTCLIFIIFFSYNFHILMAFVSICFFRLFLSDTTFIDFLLLLFTIFFPLIYFSIVDNYLYLKSLALYFDNRYVVYRSSVNLVINNTKLTLDTSNKPVYMLKSSFKKRKMICYFLKFFLRYMLKKKKYSNKVNLLLLLQLLKQKKCTYLLFLNFDLLLQNAIVNTDLVKTVDSTGIVSDIYYYKKLDKFEDNFKYKTEESKILFKYYLLKYILIFNIHNNKDEILSKLNNYIDFYPSVCSFENKHFYFLLFDKNKFNKKETYLFLYKFLYLDHINTIFLTGYLHFIKKKDKA